MEWDIDIPDKEPEIFVDPYQEEAKNDIREIISREEVVTDRELKVRLEKKYFPWVTGYALESLVSEGLVNKVGHPGRGVKLGTPKYFYIDTSLKYEETHELRIKKRDITTGINAILTRHAPAGTFAEDVFERAFNSLGCRIHDRDVSVFKKRKVKGVRGKELPNLDFIIEKKKKLYGVDIKNWIKYEKDTVAEVCDKINLSIQLGVIPLICARYIDKDTIYNHIYKRGGRAYIYETLLIPRTYRSLAQDASRYLGYPISIGDRLPSYKINFIDEKILI
jgi:hypothetical protein